MNDAMKPEPMIHHSIVLGEDAVATCSYQFVLKLKPGSHYTAIMTEEEAEVLYGLVSRLEKVEEIADEDFAAAMRQDAEKVAEGIAR